ncbi:hypothetical protein GGD62_007982, partial [Bradyrhizobium sp. ERR14]|nr:hypothetical protein [Bradyrhizobium sp. ERR14]
MSVGVSAAVNPPCAKIFHFTEIRFRRMCRASRLTKRGDYVVVTVA